MKTANRSKALLIIAVGALAGALLAGAPGTAGDHHAFKEQILTHIQKARPAWSEEQRQRLAGVIVSDLQTKLGSKLTDELRADLLKYFDSTVSIFDASADAPTVKMTVEYYRWAITELAARRPIANDQVKQMEEQIRKCFAEAAVAVKPLFPADLHQQIDRSASTQLHQTLNSLYDPLFPGLKNGLTHEHIAAAIKTCQASCQEILEIFDEMGGLSKLKKPDATYDEAVRAPFEIAFRQLRVGLEYSQVVFGPELAEAMKAHQHEKQKQREAFKKGRERFKADAEKEFRERSLEEELKRKTISPN